ncbi:hypothetical protein IV487_01795 [Enterococcus saccharolyticus]|uniref:hypothetical protein n=1 Tax=Enterococcus saccharolyticus TaxID=41997 RepID=UPI001E50A3B6|nr:hypothetical protein [Enterococcus saccharolyticus]MCD5001196.1 hypothetical protein [Enterococcus saccharolyticus]
MNKPLQNSLLLIILVLSVLAVSSHYYILTQAQKVNQINQRQQLEIAVYKSEISELQARLGYTTNENQNKDEVD